MTRAIKIGTRSSKLALWQANWVKDQLQKKYPKLTVLLIPIKTTGDKILNVSLSKIGGKGLFIKEIEDKLIDETIDLAVHSIKDLPAELPAGLVIAAIPSREDPRDVLVSASNLPFDKLPPGSRIGTSSLRRSCQLKKKRRDLQYKELRGNVDTRLKKLHAGEFDAIVLAAAGLIRLGLKGEISHFLEIIPAVGQGAIGIEIRKDSEILKMVSFLNEPSTDLCVTAERAYLKVMGGGCQVPLGCYAQIMGDQIKLDAFLSDVEGVNEIVRSHTVPKSEGIAAAKAMAKEILASGGKEILEKIIF